MFYDMLHLVLRYSQTAPSIAMVNVKSLLITLLIVLYLSMFVTKFACKHMGFLSVITVSVLVLRGLRLHVD